MDHQLLLPAPTKASDFKDLKTILNICGPRAKLYNNSFDDIGGLALYLLHFCEQYTPAYIGRQLDEIIMEVHNPQNSWLYTTWTHIDTTGKNSIEILEELGETSLEQSGMNIEDISYSLGTEDTKDMIQIVLSYFASGRPNIDF